MRYIYYVVDKEIIDLNKGNSQNQETEGNLTLLVLGGSQAAKIFAEILPNIFKESSQMHPWTPQAKMKNQNRGNRKHRYKSLLN